MFRSFTIVVLVILIGILSVGAQDGTTPIPVTTEIVQQAFVNQDGIQFTFDAEMADTISIATYPATGEGSAMIPSPAFTEFTFEGYSDGDYTAYAPMPRVDIFPIEGFGAYPFYVEQLDLLTSIIAERPDLNRYVVAGTNGVVENVLPFLPIFNAAQVFRVQPQVIETANLRGIRYLVYYSQAMNPITEGEVFYTFQGVTADGQHYVSAILPINTGTIPTDAHENVDPDAFASQYATYLDDVLGMLSAADVDSFTPSLYTLDQLVQSIRVR
ncbi:MAG: hypothetical protein RLP44_29995 [Aggregatilineales bacterium]